MTAVPPPPPPPPPPSRTARSTQAANILYKVSKTRRAIDESRNKPLARATERKFNRPFTACQMFFYGSLIDPDVVQVLLDLTERPIFKPATISDFRTRMWGIYPALIPSKSSTVSGVMWGVTKEEHFDRLAAYETSAFDWTECDAKLEDGTVLKGCRTFCWAAEPDSKELEDGQFDLQHFQKYFKSSVVRRL